MKIYVIYPGPSKDEKARIELEMETEEEVRERFLASKPIKNMSRVEFSEDEKRIILRNTTLGDYGDFLVFYLDGRLVTSPRCNPTRFAEALKTLSEWGIAQDWSYEEEPQPVDEISQVEQKIQEEIERKTLAKRLDLPGQIALAEERLSHLPRVRRALQAGYEYSERSSVWDIKNYNRYIPLEVLEEYEKALDFFDEFVVASEDDPELIGKIGPYRFTIGRW